MNRLRDLVLAWLALVLLFVQAAYSAAGQNGTIVGTVRLAGNGSAQDTIAVTKDPEICGKSKPGTRLILGANQGVANSIIYLQGPVKGKTWAKADYIMDQQKCVYVPHVLVMPVGTEMDFANADPVLHNIHAYDLSSAETLFNIALPIKGMRIKKALSKPGIYLLTCDAGHPWMTGYLFVAENPYVSITDGDGNFRLTDVPAGHYKLTFWHEGVATAQGATNIPEKCYTDTKDIVLQPGKEVRMDFTLQLRQ
jgi:plastocyanin